MELYIHKIIKATIKMLYNVGNYFFTICFGRLLFDQVRNELYFFKHKEMKTR